MTEHRLLPGLPRVARIRASNWRPPTLGVLAVAVLALLQVPMHGPVGGLLDLFPLYHGALAWLHTGDAYVLDPNLPNLGQLTEVGNAYPIHAVLFLGLPFTPFTAPVAGILWVLVVGFAWIAAIAWSRQSWYWLLWFPMWDALRMQQASAVVTVAAILALGALQKRSKWPFILALVLMSTKPQQMLILMLVMAWYGRQWWRSMLVSAAAVVAVSFLAQPDWVGEWMHRVAERSQIVPSYWVMSAATLPLAALMLRRGWHWPGIALLSSTLGPWPQFGYYVTSAWPLGATRDQAALMMTVGLCALGAAVVLGFAAFPLVLLPGLALVVLLHRPETREAASIQATTDPVAK